MKYILDTNTFIFLIDKDYQRLSKKQSEIVGSRENELFLTEASLFEIAIKIRLDKPNFNRFDMINIETYRKKTAYQTHQVKGVSLSEYYITTIDKILKKDGKPHADSFDLLIISIAETENLPIYRRTSIFQIIWPPRPLPKH